jgi:hypothetical protein
MSLNILSCGARANPEMVRTERPESLDFKCTLASASSPAARFRRLFLVRFLGEQKMNKPNFKTKKVTWFFGDQEMNK